jgi:aspartate-semialdehyde dehydrogenase
MDRDGKDRARTRVAIVGASTPEGAHLRGALIESGVAGSRVDLYGVRRGEVLVSEYGSEARLIQEPDLEAVVGHELVFLCEPGEFAARLGRAAGDAVVIELGQFLPPEIRPPRVDVDLDPAAVAGSTRCFGMPHPLALLLAQVLRPLDRELGVGEASAVILRPAADFGEDGLEELRQQTVGLLSFAEFPAAVFGRQLAFNLIPQSRLRTAPPSLEQRLVAEVRELLAWSEDRLALRLIAAPLFHGHALQLRIRLAEGATTERARAALTRAGFADPAAADAAVTPIEVTGEARTALSDLVHGGLGAYWIWVVAGEADAGPARQAVRLAARLGLV